MARLLDCCLKVIATRQIPIPDFIDIWYLDKEVRCQTWIERHHSTAALLLLRLLPTLVHVAR